MPKKQEDSPKVDQLHTMRHSAAHLLAAAVQKLYPHAKFGVGPVIENGFYYDIDVGNDKITQDDLLKVEGEMEVLKKKQLLFEHRSLSISEAMKLFAVAQQEYKVELLQDIKKYGTTVFKEMEEGADVSQEIVKSVTLYQTGDFVDLCRGPHVEHTGKIGFFKLTSVAGAYWRGDEKNPMLTRIYGTAFETKEELDHYLWQLEEAKKRDHRKIGKDQELFLIDEMVGKGLPLWLPNGTIVKDEIEKFVKEMEQAFGYVRVSTPHLARKELFETSGHLPYYKDTMYPPMEMDDGEYYVKAMNCPYHHIIYKSKMRSYRDLPLRLAEYGTVYRNERSGTLAGLLRVRSLQMNDAHIYCRKDQIEEETKRVVDLTRYYFTVFGLKDYWFRLSKWDPEHTEKYINEPENWKYAEGVLRKVLKEAGVQFEEAEDEAAFYGPKIDVQFTSVIGREETMSTIQLDFAAKRRFGLTYADKGGKENSEVFVIHRAPLSTHERFIAFLIEHFAGAFPVWLSPVQVVLATVADSFNESALNLAQEMRGEGIRVEVDDANETVGNKVRKASNQKVPYILVIGEKEVSGRDFQVRERGVEKQYSMSKQEFIEKIKKQITQRSNK